MIIQNKTCCVMVTVICLATLSLPSHAWQEARGAYGGAAVRTPSGNTAYRPPSGYGGAYHAPVNVNYGYSSGQVAAAGLAVGAMVGSAAAKSNQPSRTSGSI